MGKPHLKTMYGMDSTCPQKDSMHTCIKRTHPAVHRRRLESSSDVTGC